MYSENNLNKNGQPNCCILLPIFYHTEMSHAKKKNGIILRDRKGIGDWHLTKGRRKNEKRKWTRR